jgi:hypothetical protein
MADRRRTIVKILMILGAGFAPIYIKKRSLIQLAPFFLRIKIAWTSFSAVAFFTFSQVPKSAVVEYGFHFYLATAAAKKFLGSDTGTCVFTNFSHVSLLYNGISYIADYFLMNQVYGIRKNI